MSKLAQWLPIISAAVGRDVSPEVAAFYRGRAAVGQALNPEGRQFVMDNWRSIVDFMETEGGREAIGVFVGSWLNSLIPQPSTSEVQEVEPDQPPQRTVQRQPQRPHRR